jgi:porphobilinogen synthase
LQSFKKQFTMKNRPRRLRNSSILRDTIAETQFNKNSLVFPIFVTKGTNVQETIPSMPGIFRFSPDRLVKESEHWVKLGMNKFLLFGTGEHKSPDAHAAWHDHGVVQDALHAMRRAFGNQVYLITDVCLCAYTDHGHCGLLAGQEILNDESLEPLAHMALSHAQAGADMVAPSDMMDGRIAALRQRLDGNGYHNIPIMSYSVKYASSYYGPFRDAADSSPSFGDRKTYQMDFRNSREALKEAALDLDEGADILMVKPALAYLDILKSLKDNLNVPVACYNVSGEFSMVKAAAANGWMDEERVVKENMYAFARAGADIIITYHTKDIFEKNWL